jgi:hypothetical protein
MYTMGSRGILCVSSSRISTSLQLGSICCDHRLVIQINLRSGGSGGFGIRTMLSGGEAFEVLKASLFFHIFLRGDMFLM